MATSDISAPLLVYANFTILFGVAYLLGALFPANSVVASADSDRLECFLFKQNQGVCEDFYKRLVSSSNEVRISNALIQKGNTSTPSCLP